MVNETPTPSELSSWRFAMVGITETDNEPPGLVDCIPVMLDMLLLVSDDVVVFDTLVEAGDLDVVVAGPLTALTGTCFGRLFSSDGSPMKGGLWSLCSHSLYTVMTRRMASAWLKGNNKA